MPPKTILKKKVEVVEPVEPVEEKAVDSRSRWTITGTFSGKNDYNNPSYRIDAKSHSHSFKTAQKLRSQIEE